MSCKFLFIKLIYKHFFCNDCINTWLLKKKNNCPICRYEVDLKDYQDKKKSKGEWTIINFDNIDYIRETEKLMMGAVNDILNS